MKTTAATAKEYFESLPTERREALALLRGMIERIWPNAKEDMAYGMPTYRLDGHALCAIANQKHFMALYIMPFDLLDAFKSDLKVFDRGKSCIRFKRLEPATVDLFDRIIKYTGNQMATSLYFGKARRARGDTKAAHAVRSAKGVVGA